MTCTATDTAGNSSSKSFNVTVNFVDKEPPVLTVPEDMTVNATVNEDESGEGANVEFSVSATDNVDKPRDIKITCDPKSGDWFDVGTTKVTCTATDTAGNSSSKSFNVTVQSQNDSVDLI